MNKPVKLPEIRKEAFTKAREDLGLSTKDISGMACLSVRQIEQIENGELSSFYGPKVKLTAAKKVAKLLKLSESEAFDLGGAEAVKKEDVKSAAEEVQESTLSAVNIAMPAASPAIEMPAMKVDKSQGDAKPHRKIFLLVSIAAAVAFSVVNLQPLFFPETPKVEPALAQDAAPTAPEAQTPESKPASAPAPEAPNPPTASVPAAMPAVAQTSSECPPADLAAVAYKPESAKKAGDMVYLQSKIAQTVCVVDAGGKIQSKAMEPGIGASFYGKPPLKVMTSGLNQVDMYYQGSRVRLGNTVAKTVVLEPAEIVQSTAPADSQ
ncbi:helix-turn-helix domain-containing protein [Polynucleobacter necessarius]|uniref:helix-turn-helix domain-containing protein n=1 Tax=Polynucleobacter necessarius TaxID=576610 RepID=UPI000E08E69A|nr:helix-turn-helix domain-containing protein [Polynucleobacter necessarius]